MQPVLSLKWENDNNNNNNDNNNTTCIKSEMRQKLTEAVAIKLKATEQKFFEVEQSETFRLPGYYLAEREKLWQEGRNGFIRSFLFSRFRFWNK